MRIVHFYDGHERVLGGRGSVPNVVWNIAHETRQKGHEVAVIEREWHNTTKVETKEGVEFYRLSLNTGSDQPYEQIPYEMVENPRGILTLALDRTNFALKGLRLLRSLDYDLLHVHLPFAANVLVSIAPWLRERLVYTAHLGETTQRVIEPRFSPDVYLANRTASTIALNPEIKEAFLSRGVPEEKLTVIPNGTDIQRFNQVDPSLAKAVCDEYGLNGKQVVLFVGTVTPRKGVLELVQAANQFDALENTKFVIVGKTDIEPAYVKKIEQFISEKELDEFIDFTGFVSEEKLLAFYDIADIFTLPSFEEGSSVAVAEAVAAGVPIVASRIDGIRQQFIEGKHGLLTEPGDTKALATSLEILLMDDERRRKMGSAVRNHAQERSWSQVTGDIITLYSQVIDE